MDLPRSWKTFGDGHPVYRLLLVSKMIDRETASSLQKEFALSLPEWRVLAFVCGLGAASASEIGHAVAKLEGKELIKRDVDKNNRKRLIISATEAGMELFASVRARRREYSRDVLDGLSEQECDMLSRALESIALRIIEKRN
jgi:DNA-binding MarR family transcriptional regulator